MSVEDILTGSHAVSQENVEPLAADTGCVDRSLKANGRIEKVCADRFVEISERRHVTAGHNEHVPRIDRLDVHERDHDIVVIDDARGLAAGENFTEDACGQLWGRGADRRKSRPLALRIPASMRSISSGKIRGEGPGRQSALHLKLPGRAGYSLGSGPPRGRGHPRTAAVRQGEERCRPSFTSIVCFAFPRYTTSLIVSPGL
jgi:hypothetical protein